MRRYLLAASLLTLTACAARPSSPAADRSIPQELTLEGEIVDSWCWAMEGKTGPEHQQCARNCLSNGNPPVLVTADGTAWLLIPAYDHIPVLDAAKRRAGEPVVLVGNPYRKGGMNILAIRELRAP